MNQRLIIHYLLQKLEEKNKRIKELEEEVEDFKVELECAESQIQELESDLSEYSGIEYDRVNRELIAELERDLI